MESVSYALSTLQDYRRYLTKQEYLTLRGQILAGHPAAALRGLRRLLRRMGL